MKGYYIQRNFTGGEFSPLLEGQIEYEKYPTALRRMENMVIDPRGPAKFAPGFRFIAGTKDSSKVSILVPFVFSAKVGFAIEIGDQYIRFFKTQAPVLSGGVPYEIASPYASDDLSTLWFRCQSADVIYFFHQDYPPYKLSRGGDTSWTMVPVRWLPMPMKEVGAKPNVTLTLAATTGTSILFTAGSSAFLTSDVGRQIRCGGGRATITSYTSGTQVTCDIIDDFASAGPLAAGTWTITGSPVIAVSASATSPVGQLSTVSGGGATTSWTNLLTAENPPENNWIASGSGTDEYYLINTAPTYQAAKPGRIQVNATETEEMVEGIIGTLGVVQWAWGDNDALGYDTIYVRLEDGTDPDTKSTFAVPDNDYLRAGDDTATTGIFRAADVGKFIKMHKGIIEINQFIDTNNVSGEIVVALDAGTSTEAWTLEEAAWDDDKGYPCCGCFYGSRLFAAGTPTYPETIWGSKVSDFENMGVGTEDADALEYQLAGGNGVNMIKWIEPRDFLIVGTIGGEWKVSPTGTGTALTPTNVDAKEQTSYGSNGPAPIAPESILFIQTAQRKIREFTFDWTTEGYIAPDLTLVSEHLTKNKLKGMVYQQEPYSIVWVWTETGELLGMTYMRDQKIVGWHKHPRDCEIESMCVIPGDGYNEVWAIIKRTVNGATVRYVEMMEPFYEDTPEKYAANKGLNARFLDSALNYSGAAATTFSGLSHLEGESVVALADGSYVVERIVSGGQITLPRAATVVHVGLAYTGLIETMNLNMGLADGTSQGRKKKVGPIIARVYASGPFKAGISGGDMDVCRDQAAELIMGGSFPLYSGDLPTIIDSGWNRNGRIMLMQDKPLPFTLVALIEEVDIS